VREFAFYVPGTPVGKARARVTRRGSYTPKKSRDYEKHIASIAGSQFGAGMLMTGAVELFVVATFEPPKSWSKKKRADAISGLIKKTTKPDKSNIEKSVEDALNGIVYVDDAQITDSICRKRYGEESGILVRVKEI